MTNKTTAEMHGLLSAAQELNKVAKLALDDHQLARRNLLELRESGAIPPQLSALCSALECLLVWERIADTNPREISLVGSTEDTHTVLQQQELLLESRPDWKAIRDMTIDGMNAYEISEKMGVGKSQVYAKISRMRKLGMLPLSIRQIEGSLNSQIDQKGGNGL